VVLFAKLTYKLQQNTHKKHLHASWHAK